MRGEEGLEAERGEGWVQIELITSDFSNPWGRIHAAAVGLVSGNRKRFE